MTRRLGVKSSAWRERLLRRMRWVVLPALAVSACLAAGLARTPTTRILGFSLAGWALAVLGFSSPRRSYYTRAWGLVATILAVSTSAYLVVGFNPGPVLAIAFALVLTGLLLGPVALGGVLVSMCLVSFSLAGAISAGWWVGPPMREVATDDPIVWARVTMISAVFWSAISFSVFFAVDTLERTARRRKRALDDKDEALRRLHEEAQARREAESVAAQAQKLDALGHFAAGVAHDFNNALLVVKGWTEILGESDTEDDRAQALEAIDQATDHAAELARQILTFGRREARAPRYLALDELVDQTARTLRRVLPTTVSVELTLQRDHNAVFADEAQLRQVIVNLVINARDAIETRGTIQVRTYSRTAADTGDPALGWVILEVEDDGVGMDETTRRRAFEPFYTTKKMGEGNGLGLSTVFGIARQSGGQVEIESELGRGTRVIVALPRVEVAADDAHAVAPPADPIAHRGARVLVLEDDPMARDLLAYALRRGAFEVEVVGDGDRALERLSRSGAPLDLLCTDAVFPGAPLPKVIEAFERYAPQGRVLICSGYVPEELAIHDADARRHRFLAKPCTGRELVAAVEALLARAAPPRRRPTAAPPPPGAARP